MRTFVFYVKSEIIGSCPVNTVCNYLLNVRIVEGTAAFMTGLEIEYLSRASVKACTASEYVSIFKPTDEEKSIGLGNEEGLGINFLRLYKKMVGNSCTDGVTGIYVPDNFLLLTAPLEISVCSDNRLEYL